MADIDEAPRRLTFRFLCYGPAQSGRTSNLMRLRDLPRPPAFTTNLPGESVCRTFRRMLRAVFRFYGEEHALTACHGPGEDVLTHGVP